jgi:1,4-alpha-glucan branching enzyme
MKKRISGKSTTGVASARPTRFELVCPEAREVFLAGTFNDWHPTTFPMIAAGEGRWVKDLALPPGRHEYLFVADGIWTPDPDSAECVPNPHGGTNSVVIVPEDPSPSRSV